jgi:ABC-type nitrate/sulfonate/bicarbonate transport system substrate-binding protein
MASQTTRRRFLVASGAVLAAPMISRGAAAQLKPIKMAWIRQFAPAGMVQKAVEFAKADGLTIEQIAFTRGLDGMVALQKGDAIACNCLVGYSQLCLAIAQGIDLTALSGGAAGLNALIISTKSVPKDQIDEKNKAYVGPEPWKLLKGKTVGAPRGSQNEFLLRSYMKLHGLDYEKDIKFVDLKANADQVLALQQGSIDVAALIEPSATQARMAGHGVLLAFPFGAGDFARLNSGLYARTDALKQYPEELQRLVNAHVKAIKFYQANPAAWATDTAKVTLFDTPTVTHLMDPKQLGLEPKYWANVELDFKLPVKDLQAYAKNLYESGFVNKDVSDQLPAHLDYTMLSKATGLSKSELGG